ncbi:MAG: autotransporter-associated beta strand repeat-containing protein, partial [Blastocatellia bacterium]|nr:autotransporter-associated beta strand repeat-containing protein [Blastocatellia bacterium]
MKTAKLNQFPTRLTSFCVTRASRSTIHPLPKRLGTGLLICRFRRPAIAAMIVLTAMATALFVVQAATIEWANVGATWSTGANWVGGTAPADSTVTDIASFGSTGSSAVNPNLTVQRSINGITFLSGAFPYTVGGSIITIGSNGISNSATNTETLANGIRTSTSQAWTTNSAGTLVLSSTVDIVNSGSGTRTLTVNGAGNTTFNGVVQNLGAGSTGILAYSGTGFLTLAGTNTFTGGITVSAGTLNMNNAAALGTGTFTISGGSIDNTSGGAIGPLTNNNPQTWNGNFTFIGTNNINFGTGAVALGTTAGTTRIITTSAGTLTIGGVISNGTSADSLTKAGAGTLILSGANTYSGTTKISAGTLRLGASGVLSDSSSMNLNGGTFSTGVAIGFTETAGTLALTDHSVIALGTGSHTLTFADSNAVPWTTGKKLVITGWTGGYDGTTGTSGQIFVGTSSAGLTANQLAQISFYDGANSYAAAILPTGEIVPGPGPTAVKLTKFNAASYTDGVQLTWESGFEVNNLGFSLYREQNGKRTRVTPSLVAGSALVVGQGNRLTAGYSYSWFDPQGTRDAAYYLEAIDLDGTRQTHGPSYPYGGSRNGVSPKRQRALLLNELGKSLANNSGGVNATGWPASMSAAARSETLKLKPQSLAGQQAIAGSKAVKLELRQTGWYRVTQPELVAAGFDPSSEARLLQLFVDGEEVPVRLSAEGARLNANDTLEFYGVALDTQTTDTRTYWLVNGTTAGKRISAKRNKIKAGDQNWTESPGLRSFEFTVERRDKLIYA